jgi:hypothetical protein
MAITAEQIKFYKSIYVNDSLTNGGRIGSTLMTDGALNNLFRNVQSEERELGTDLYRKFFIKNENPNDISLENPKIWISNVSSGEDYFQIALGSDINNQSVADDITDWYGSGYLDENIASGETSFYAQFKQASGLPSGSFLMISDGVHQSEVLMLDAPSWNGSRALITISDEVGFDFLQGETIVSAIIPLENLTPILSNWAETSVAGVYDEAVYPLTLYNIGTITESWTLTFSNPTTFEVTGAVIGSIGSGSVNSNFVPINGAGYYFNLSRMGWSGSWAEGDTITFNTVHASQAIWVKESIPSGSASQSNNLMSISLIGESA